MMKMFKQLLWLSLLMTGSIISSCSSGFAYDDGVIMIQGVAEPALTGNSCRVTPTGEKMPSSTIDLDMFAGNYTIPLIVSANLNQLIANGAATGVNVGGGAAGGTQQQGGAAYPNYGSVDSPVFQLERVYIWFTDSAGNALTDIAGNTLLNGSDEDCIGETCSSNRIVYEVSGIISTQGGGGGAFASSGSGTGVTASGGGASGQAQIINVPLFSSSNFSTISCLADSLHRQESTDQYPPSPPMSCADGEMLRSNYCNPSQTYSARILAQIQLEGQSSDGAKVRSLPYAYPIDMCRSCLQPKGPGPCSEFGGRVITNSISGCFPFGTEEVALVCDEDGDGEPESDGTFSFCTE